eukprot:6491630-Amphidinium_carterae.4
MVFGLTSLDNQSRRPSGAATSCCRRLLTVSKPPQRIYRPAKLVRLPCTVPWFWLLVVPSFAHPLGSHLCELSSPVSVSLPQVLVTKADGFGYDVRSCRPLASLLLLVSSTSLCATRSLLVVASLPSGSANQVLRRAATHAPFVTLARSTLTLHC